MCYRSHVQSHVHANKSRRTYVRDVRQLSKISFIVFQNTSHVERVIEPAIVSEQYQLYCNERSHLKQLYFRKKNFFRTPSCLEQLLPSNNYFVLLNTFSDELPVDDKYFSAQMLLRMSYIFRISNYLDHVLFRN